MFFELGKSATINDPRNDILAIKRFAQIVTNNAAYFVWRVEGFFWFSDCELEKRGRSDIHNVILTMYSLLPEVS